MSEDPLIYDDVPALCYFVNLSPGERAMLTELAQRMRCTGSDVLRLLVYDLVREQDAAVAAAREKTIQAQVDRLRTVLPLPDPK